MVAFNILNALAISIIEPLLPTAAAVGFSWLAVPIGMTVADVLTRVVLPSPW
ncbi:hypothetical protein [Rhodanobacter sp. Root480]|uniref:ComEC/Rec2-related protein domain-containing protein n=1 Tax=Rhodanobacter ginsenosidimutans TaxID=490571 RepID=A0ABW0JXH6_9GAMM|nr:hypothetical protein [Rhodanobacter sp. Root480]